MPAILKQKSHHPRFYRSLFTLLFRKRAGGIRRTSGAGGIFPGIAALALTGVLAACSRNSQTATVLGFTEQEPEGVSFTTRMVVTAGYLRIDDDAGAEGFILLDRARRTIYSVNHGDRRVLVIEPLKVGLAPPKAFEHRVEQDPEASPSVAGREVRHYRLYTNGKLCFDVFAADGLLPEVLAALREYHEVLAGEQAAALARTPEQFRTACDLADDVFLPVRHLAHGFPVGQRSAAGRLRELTDIRTDVAVESGLFELPPDYRRFGTADLGR